MRTGRPVQPLREHGIERNFGEPGHRAVIPVINRARHAAAMEDLDPLTAVRQNRYAMFSTVPSTGTRLPEGCQHSSGIEARDILRGRHENDAIETNRLQERRERLTGARWQVEHHDIESPQSTSVSNPRTSSPTRGALSVRRACSSPARSPNDMMRRP